MIHHDLLTAPASHALDAAIGRALGVEPSQHLAVKTGMWQESQPDWPRYTSDPAADYAVLEMVRAWGAVKLCDVRDAVKDIWDRRAMEQMNYGEVVWGCTQYLPGDWARAAAWVAQQGKDAAT